MDDKTLELKDVLYSMMESITVLTLILKDKGLVTPEEECYYIKQAREILNKPRIDNT